MRPMVAIAIRAQVSALRSPGQRLFRRLCRRFDFVFAAAERDTVFDRFHVEPDRAIYIEKRIPF